MAMSRTMSRCDLAITGRNPLPHKELRVMRSDRCTNWVQKGCPADVPQIGVFVPLMSRTMAVLK